MAEPNSTGQETLEESMERLETILDTLEGDDISPRNPLPSIKRA